MVIATNGKDYLSRLWRIKREKGKAVDLVLDTAFAAAACRPSLGRFDSLLEPA